MKMVWAKITGKPETFKTQDLVDLAYGIAQRENPEYVMGDFKTAKPDQTKTEAFRKWFGDSAVVDADGKPLVVYHGTDADFTKFDLSKFGRTDAGWFGKGFYFTDSQAIAGRYGKVKSVFLRIEKPMPADEAAFEVATIRQITAQTKRLDPQFSPKDWLADDIAGEKSALDQLEKMYRAGAEPSKVLQAVTNVTGFDGVVSKGIYIAFSPTQIKSATGNNGQFDGANPDIRFSRTSNPHSWDAPEPSKFDDLVYKLQDKQIDTKRVVEEIRKTGKALADEKDVYLQEELFHGRAAARTEDFVNNELSPLITEMKMRGIDIAALDEYLHARHAQEANELIADHLPIGHSLLSLLAKCFGVTLALGKLLRFGVVIGHVSKADGFHGLPREGFASSSAKPRRTKRRATQTEQPAHQPRALCLLRVIGIHLRAILRIRGAQQIRPGCSLLLRNIRERRVRDLSTRPDSVQGVQRFVPEERLFLNTLLSGLIAYVNALYRRSQPQVVIPHRLIALLCTVGVRAQGDTLVSHPRAKRLVLLVHLRLKPTKDRILRRLACVDRLRG